MWCDSGNAVRRSVRLALSTSYLPAFFRERHNDFYRFRNTHFCLIQPLNQCCIMKQAREYLKLENSYDSEARDNLIDRSGDHTNTAEETSDLRSPTLIFSPGFFKRKAKSTVSEDSKYEEPAENSSNEIRSGNVTNNIGFDDGKTKECNRSHTFETFIHSSRLGNDEPAKRIGHGWEVWRALQRVKRVNRGKRAFTKRIPKIQ